MAADARFGLKRVLVAVAALVLASGCSTVVSSGGPATDSTTPSGQPAATESASGSPTATAATRTTQPDPPPASALTPPAGTGLSWRPAGMTVRGVPVTYVATTAGGSIGLLWMDTAVLRFRFIPGFAIPENTPVLPADRRPSSWVPWMAAAFNGGFKLSDGAGGYYYAGKVVRTLRPGLAALTITNAGRISVVKWGREQSSVANLLVVRENLPLLVDSYRARTSPSDTARTWGVANGGLSHANRSALGQRADGSVVFAFGADVTPAAMAAAMVQVDARTAIALDMNKSWPGGFVYSHHAGVISGRRILSPIWHSPSVYYGPFTKDFVVALIQP
jgi:uncharacterized protein YceK